MRALVLVGAGHAHVEVLRRFGRRPMSGAALTLITRARHTPYSGMLPGLVAGHYQFADAHIDAAALAEYAGARLVLAEATGLDVAGRRVLCGAAEAVPFTLASLDIGSHPNTGDIAGAAEHTIPVKPIDGFLARFAAVQARVRAGRSRHVLMVGGGAGGVELMLAVAYRLRQEAEGMRFTLVTRSGGILPGFPPAFRAKLGAALAQYRVAVHAIAAVAAVMAQRVVLADGSVILADEVLWTTEAAPAAWLAQTGLAVDAQGFLCVDAHLRAGADIFAAGDMIAFGPQPLARSGVHAVRAGPVLAANLRAALSGGPLRRYQPQAAALAIVSTGDRCAVATRNGLVGAGHWAWWVKDRIDRRFMARYAHRDNDVVAPS